MRLKKIVEEDVLETCQLLNYPLLQTIKDGLEARLVKIKNGEDPYKREDNLG